MVPKRISKGVARVLKLEKPSLHTQKMFSLWSKEGARGEETPFNSVFPL